VQMRAISLYVYNYYIWGIDLNCILDVQYIIVSDLMLVFQYWCPWGAGWSVDYEGVSLGSRVVGRSFEKKKDCLHNNNNNKVPICQRGLKINI
jgi:hypothetical protein